MQIDVVTLFPQWFDWFRGQRHVANALEAGHDLRETVGGPIDDEHLRLSRQTVRQRLVVGDAVVDK